SLQWNAQPGRRRGTDQFDFARGGQAVEFRLRDRTRLAGSENVRHAGAGNFLRRGRRIELVHEKREMEHFGLRVVESDEKVFRVNDLLQGVVNLKQEIVKVCSLVEGMNDVGEDQALRFHALHFRDVVVGNDYAL